MHDDKARNRFPTVEKGFTYPRPVIVVESIPGFGQEYGRLGLRVDSGMNEEQPPLLIVRTEILQIRQTSFTQSRSELAHEFPIRHVEIQAEHECRIDRRGAAEFRHDAGAAIEEPQPGVPARLFLEREPHHLFVIAHQWNDLVESEGSGIVDGFDDGIYGPKTVGAPVIEVSEHDKDVSVVSPTIHRESIKQCMQCRRLSVNVADSAETRPDRKSSLQRTGCCGDKDGFTHGASVHRSAIGDHTPFRSGPLPASQVPGKAEPGSSRIGIHG